MIDAKKIFDTVFDRVRPPESGDIGIESYNRFVSKAEDKLYESSREVGAINSEMQAALMPFRREFAPPQNLQGQYTLPANYLQYISVSRIVGLNQRQEAVEVLADAKWANRSTSKAIPIERNPIARIMGNTLQILPENSSLHLVYYTKFEYGTTNLHCKYGFTTNNDDEIIYDASTSVNSIFEESQFDQLIDLICNEIAIGIRDGEIINQNI